MGRDDHWHVFLDRIGSVAVPVGEPAAHGRSLRRLGHQVIAMEDFTAAAAYPLDRVLELVRSADGFVLIVAWRYGYIPPTPPAEPPQAPLSAR